MSDLETPSETTEETWSDFLAPEAVAFDTDGDAMADTVLVDTDADAVADTVVMDTDADAVADTVVMDTDADAAADTVVMDTDADAVADTVIVDSAVAPADSSDAASEVSAEAAVQTDGEALPDGPPEMAAFDQDADDVADAPGEFDPFPDTEGVTDAQWAQALEDAEGDRTIGPLDEGDVPTNEDLDQALTDLDTTSDIGNYL